VPTSGITNYRVEYVPVVHPKGQEKHPCNNRNVPNREHIPHPAPNVPESNKLLYYRLVYRMARRSSSECGSWCYDRGGVGFEGAVECYCVDV